MLSALKFVAGQTGVSMEDLETGVKKMEKTIQAAADGVPEAVAALAHLGTTAAQLKNLTTDQALVRLADGVAGIANPMTRAARAMEVFGKGGTSLLPMLNQGADSIRELILQANRLGLIKTEAEVREARELQKAFEMVTGSIGSVRNAIGAGLAPMIIELSKLAMPIIKDIKEWVKENRALFDTIALVGGGATLLGIGLVAVGGGVKLLAIAISPITTIVKTLTGALGFLLKAGLAINVANPFVIIGAAAVAGGVALLTMTDDGQAALGTLKEGFEAVSTVATTTWSGISKAVANGDFAGAIEIAMLGVSIGFETAIESLKISWRAFSGFFVSQFRSATTRVADLIDSTLHGFDTIRAGFRALSEQGGGAAAPLLSTLFTGGASTALTMFGPTGAGGGGLFGLGPAIGAPNLNASREQLAQQRYEFAREINRRVQEFRQANPGAALPAGLQRGVDLVRQHNADMANDPDLLHPAAHGPNRVTPGDMADADELRDRKEREQLDAASRARIAELRRQIQEAVAKIEMKAKVDKPDKAIQKTTDSAIGKSEIKGTFNPFGVWGMGAESLTDIAKKQLEETIEIRRNTEVRNAPAFG